MKINIVYEIGDPCFVLYNNKVERAVVNEVDINICDHIAITYHVLIGGSIPLKIPEYAMHRTKESLLSSL